MQCRGAKSFVDDLGLSRGVVFSRAVALLRSIETKPPDSMICPLWTGISSALGCLTPPRGSARADEPIPAGSFPLSYFHKSTPTGAVSFAPRPMAPCPATSKVYDLTHSLCLRPPSPPAHRPGDRATPGRFHDLARSVRSSLAIGLLLSGGATPPHYRNHMLTQFPDWSGLIWWARLQLSPRDMRHWPR